MIKMFKIVSTLAVALAASAGIAGEPLKTFQHDGVTYTYTATKTTDGATLLSGRTQSGERFRLTVRNGQVTGYANQRPASYSVASARGATGGAVTVTTVSTANAAD